MFACPSSCRRLSDAPAAGETFTLGASVLQPVAAAGKAAPVTLSPAKLSFTSSNWDQEQFITVTPGALAANLYAWPFRACPGAGWRLLGRGREAVQQVLACVTCVACQSVQREEWGGGRRQGTPKQPWPPFRLGWRLGAVACWRCTNSALGIALPASGPFAQRCRHLALPPAHPAVDDSAASGWDAFTVLLELRSDASAGFYKRRAVPGVRLDDETPVGERCLLGGAGWLFGTPAPCPTAGQAGACRACTELCSRWMPRLVLEVGGRSQRCLATVPAVPSPLPSLLLMPPISTPPPNLRRQHLRPPGAN